MSEVLSTKPLLSVTEAAIVAGINRNLMYKLLRESVVPDAVIRVDGCQWLVRRAALERWLSGPAA